MSELRDLMQGAAEAKRQLFASEDFADAYGRSVTGRVRRRRAVSATAMGGGTVVAVGAIAVGASNVPWNGLVFGVPASSPSVACTTTTPEPAWPPMIFTFTDLADGTNAKVAWSLDETPVLQSSGASLVELDSGDYVLTLANGTRARVGFAIFAIGLPEGADPNDYLTVGVYEGDLEVTTERAPTATPSPDVTCVTSTASPAPSPSQSLSASPSPSPSPSASPSALPATSESPFYCGGEIEGEEYGEQDFRFSQITWESPEKVNALVDRVVDAIGTDYWEDAEGADVLAVTLYTARQPSHSGLSGAGGTAPLDPLDLLALGYIDTTGDGAAFARGAGFIAVRDGVVVGTLAQTPSADGHVYSDGDDPNPTTYLLAPDGAFVSCPGVELGDDWDLYAVGGQTYAYPDGTVEDPIYTWTKIEQTS